MNAFLNQKIHAVFPSGYLDSVEGLIAAFGEIAYDAGQPIKTIYQRQDSTDVKSRRAAAPANEQPLILIDGRMLVFDVYPSTGIYAAVTSGALSGIQIINQIDLPAFLAAYGPTGEVL